MRKGVFLMWYKSLTPFCSGHYLPLNPSSLWSKNNLTHPFSLSKTEGCNVKSVIFQKLTHSCQPFENRKNSPVARFMVAILGLILFTFTVPAFAHPKCPAKKNGCNCTCTNGAGARVRGERQKKCGMIQNAKNCAKKKKKDKAEARGCGKSGPFVCAQPPMPPCPPDMMCAQVMPPARWFKNRCVAEKEGATVSGNDACQGAVPPR